MENLLDTIRSVTRDRCSAFLTGLGEPISVGLAECQNYGALLRGAHSTELSPEALVDLALRRGRVLVCGRGASGKSAAIRRAALQSVEHEHAAFLIDLSQWDRAASDEWETCKGVPREAFDFLLRRFSAGSFDISDAEFVYPPVKKVFFVDGLNETPGSTADGILAACDGIAAGMVGASVVATDRLVRRTLASEARWCFVMPLPVARQEIERLTSQTNVPAAAGTLLASPFFLDRAMRGELQSSPTATIEELISDKGRLDAAGMAASVEAAWRAYEIDGSRSFLRRRFMEVGRDDVAGTLLAGGVLVAVDEDRVAFQHHWYHDYLASVHVAGRKSLWGFETRHATLDALTFKANSFDAIAFVLEQTRGEDTEVFLRAVYDWNPYAAGYALAEANIRESDVPRPIRVIVLAMLADKCFDPHFFSARRARDGLELVRDEDAMRFCGAPTREELRRIVAGLYIDADKHFEEWRTLFALEGVTASRAISLLSDEDSVLGWTAANVVKQLRLDSNDKVGVISISNVSRPVVRWRAVHAMGGFPFPEFVSALLYRVRKDDDENVRYGAVRSLIETAAIASDLIDEVVDGLIEQLDIITESPRVLTELSGALFMREGKAPTNWAAKMSRILYALADREENASAAERWSGIASRLRLHHQAPSGSAALPQRVT